MDLAAVPEIGPSFAAKLAQAGVENAEALAAWEDLDALAAASGIDAGRLESFRDAARERLERVLAEAGVADPADLAAEDVDELMRRTGLARGYLEGYQAKARAHVKRVMTEAGYKDAESIGAIENLEDAVMKTGIAAKHLARYREVARQELEEKRSWKVVLAENAPVARVVAAGGTHDAVALLTSTPEESDDAAFARAAGDAVLLRPALDAVPARIGGTTHAALPLYKERRRPEGELEEIRVRVAEVRVIDEAEASGNKKKGGLGRLFRRGS